MDDYFERSEIESGPPRRVGRQGLYRPVDPGGPVVIILASGSEVRGFDPDHGRWIFQSVKILPSEGK